MGTHPIFESDFDCLTEGRMGIAQSLHTLPDIDELINHPRGQPSIKLPSTDSLPEKGAKPKINSNTENPRIFNGPDPNLMNAGGPQPALPIFSFMSNSLYLIGGGNFCSYELRQYNFGSLKPGTSIRFVQDHIENPTSAARCWKEKFALMMCAREMNSEKAANGPCAREAYYYGKCVNYEADNDLQRNTKILYANAYFGDHGDAYRANAYDQNFGWNKFGFSGQKGGVTNPGNMHYTG